MIGELKLPENTSNMLVSDLITYLLDNITTPLMDCAEELRAVDRKLSYKLMVLGEQIRVNISHLEDGIDFDGLITNIGILTKQFNDDLLEATLKALSTEVAGTSEEVEIASWASTPKDETFEEILRQSLQTQLDTGSLFGWLPRVYRGVMGFHTTSISTDQGNFDGEIVFVLSDKVVEDFDLKQYHYDLMVDTLNSALSTKLKYNPVMPTYESNGVTYIWLRPVDDPMPNDDWMQVFPVN